MIKTLEKMCAHSMLICAALIAIGALLIAGWLPPPAASMDAEAVHALFDSDRLAIRIGMTVMGAGGMFYIFFGSAISTQIERMSPRHGALSRIQFVMSAGTGLMITFLAFLGLALAYRDTLDAVTLQLGFDLWWLLFVGWYAPGVAQNLAIAGAVFADPAPADKKVFPQWVAYLNLWVAMSFTPGIYIAFFKSGPLAWHGILGLWIVGAGFFIWAIAMWKVVIRAIDRS